MKVIIALFISFLAVNAFSFNTSKMSENKATNPNNISVNDSVLRHVVLFKFKDGTSSEELKTIENAFGSLPERIPEIVGYEWGLNNSPEGLNKDFTHCFFVSFASEEGRATYLPHPAHKEFVDLVGPYVDDVLVIDYWVK